MLPFKHVFIDFQNPRSIVHSFALSIPKAEAASSTVLLKQTFINLFTTDAFELDLPTIRCKLQEHGRLREICTKGIHSHLNKQDQRNSL